MSSKLLRDFGITSMIISFVIIFFSAYKASMGLLIFGILFMVVSVLYLVFVMSYDIFKRDKNLDLKALSEAGLTIVVCPECHKKNVLEDKYCIYCGEELVQRNE